MRSISRRRKRFTADESGAAMVEYGLPLLFIALVVAAVVKLLGSEVSLLFGAVL